MKRHLILGAAAALAAIVLSGSCIASTSPGGGGICTPQVAVNETLTAPAIAAALPEDMQAPKLALSDDIGSSPRVIMASKETLAPVRIIKADIIYDGTPKIDKVAAMPDETLIAPVRIIKAKSNETGLTQTRIAMHGSKIGPAGVAFKLDMSLLHTAVMVGREASWSPPKLLDI